MVGVASHVIATNYISKSNTIEQFAPIDKLKHHVNLGLASSDLAYFCEFIRKYIQRNAAISPFRTVKM